MLEWRLKNSWGETLYRPDMSVGMDELSSFENLYAMIMKDFVGDNNLKENSHVIALLGDAFKGRIITQEGIYAKDHVLGYEALTRPQSNKEMFENIDFLIEGIVRKLYSAGLHIEADELFCKNALKAAKNGLLH